MVGTSPSVWSLQRAASAAARISFTVEISRTMDPRHACLQRAIHDTVSFMSGAITDVAGIAVGHAQDDERLTGCTVVLAGDGATVGVDVRGLAPAPRETDLCRPGTLVQKAH